VRRLIDPQPIAEPRLGLAIIGIATVINLGVARVLLRAGRRHESITLEADAQHLMTDVWTSLGVIVGVGAAALTGWHRLDAIVAIAVALNVLHTGYLLLRRSMLGLLDTSLPEETLATIKSILESHAKSGVRYHALRTRQAGARRSRPARSYRGFAACPQTRLPASAGSIEAGGNWSPSRRRCETENQGQ
jgi:cation diffusion facilitator family transporter